MTQSRDIILNAIVAALYAVLTIGLAPISYGPVQVRLSEVLVLLAFYNRKWIPGLIAGCIIANMDSPMGMTDIIIGTAATCVALYGMRFAPNLFLASLSPVIANGVIIGGELAYLSELPDGQSLMGAICYIGLGEFLAVSVVGVLLFKAVMKNTELRKIVLHP